MRFAMVSFGQSMPEVAIQRAQAACEQADLLIAAGSSLVVYPAADFPLLAKQAGARLVILNREPAEQDDLADLVIHDEIGPTLGAAVGVS